jgi:hypothetical protein
LSEADLLLDVGRPEDSRRDEVQRLSGFRIRRCVEGHGLEIDLPGDILRCDPLQMEFLPCFEIDLAELA